MYRLSAEQLLFLIEQFSPDSPALPSLEEAVKKGVGARGLLALAEVLTGDPKIFMLTARFEIGEGELVRTRLEGGPASEDEKTLIEEYCIFGFFRGAACFCPFSVNGYEAMKRSWRSIVARLDIVPAEPSVLSALALSCPTRTVAALTVGRTEDGKTVTHFHHHPRLSAGIAASFLRDSVYMTMPEGDA